MPAYYIGEHKISNVALFHDYLTKVVPMVERFGGRYLTKAGSHESSELERRFLAEALPIEHADVQPRAFW